MSEEHDATFVPASKLLASFGLTAKKTDEAWFNVIRSNQRKSTEMEAQNAIATFTLYKRGHSHESIAHEVGVTAKTVKAWYVQGQALLRTCDAVAENAAARTLSACKIGNGASLTLVDTATKIDGDADAKLEALEVMAVSDYVRKNFVDEEEKPLADDTIASIVTSLPEQAQANLGTDAPPTAKDMVDALPNVTEAFSIQRKVTPRDPGDPNGGTGPQTLEFHMKQALSDMLGIAKAEGKRYVPTPADVSALLKVCEYIQIPLLVDEDQVAAIEVLA